MKIEPGSNDVSMARLRLAVVRVADVVRVEGRIVGERQNLARRGPHHHDGAAARVVLANRFGERLLGVVLDEHVNR